MLRGQLLIQAKGPPNAINNNVSLDKHQIFDAVVLGVHFLGNGKPIGLGAVQLLLKHFLTAELVGPHQVFISIALFTFNGHDGFWATPAAQHVQEQIVSCIFPVHIGYDHSIFNVVMELELVTVMVCQEQPSASAAALVQFCGRFFVYRAESIPTTIQSGRHISLHIREVAIQAKQAPEPRHQEKTWVERKLRFHKGVRAHGLPQKDLCGKSNQLDF